MATFIYRGALALYAADGNLVQVAERDFDTMGCGELDSWLGELVASGVMPSAWQWGEGDDLIDNSGAVIGQCTAEAMTESEWTGQRSI